MSTFVLDSNANEVAAALTAIGVKAGARAFAVTRHFGQVLTATVQRNASLPRAGPPGPRLQTGDYVRSWNLRMEALGGVVAASAGTNRPQARRLEYGFNGPDALGRVYHQPPYPHAGPALDEVGPQFAAAILAIIDEVS